MPVFDFSLFAKIGEVLSPILSDPKIVENLKRILSDPDTIDQIRSALENFPPKNEKRPVQEEDTTPVSPPLKKGGEKNAEDEDTSPSTGEGHHPLIPSSPSKEGKEEESPTQGETSMPEVDPRQLPPDPKAVYQRYYGEKIATLKIRVPGYAATGKIVAYIRGMDKIDTGSGPYRWLFQMEGITPPAPGNKTIFLILGGKGARAKARAVFQQDFGQRGDPRRPDYADWQSADRAVKLLPLTKVIIEWEPGRFSVSFFHPGNGKRLGSVSQGIRGKFERVNYLAIGRQARPGRYQDVARNVEVEGCNIILY